MPELQPILSLMSAVLIASLLGSTHCAGMCGAFVAFAVAAPSTESRQRTVPRWLLNAGYNTGRLMTYVILGALAGGVGAALDIGGSLVGIQRIAAVVAAVVMVGFGTAAILRHSGVRIARLPLPPILIKAARAGHSRAFDLPPLARAVSVGLLTTLLPCGWLYAFVVIAAGTGHPLAGALVMSAFWTGTLPIMAAIGIGTRALAGPLRERLPLLTNLLLIGAGLFTICGRLTMPAITHASLKSPRSWSESIGAVENADQMCPLCHPKESAP